MTDELFAAPDAGLARAHRDFAALHRIMERHGATEAQRSRWSHPTVIDAYEAVCLIVSLAAGAALPEADEAPIDEADLLAALTLLPRVRADLDTLETGLLDLARNRGLTWQSIAYGLGLNTAQAAKQRYDRVAGRAAS
ncbi:DNA-binding protein [Hamadaea tsunoensis]|uniref:DNA-binding protein n=1 Tax=Hamadaea tsunoensis TaxID=53368 RepID=UPI0004003502|nr:DNA-binding protein [Hamadaea tsunoensis]